MTHEECLLQNNELAETFGVLEKMLRCYFGTEISFNTNELLSIYGALLVNGFGVTNCESEEIGSALYLAASILDHSCLPNAGVTFDGSRIVVRALQDFPNFQWSQININYIDGLTCREDRQRSLQRSYFFECHCQRCVDPEHNELENSFLCGNDSCVGVLGVGVTTIARCARCGFDGYSECAVQYWRVVARCRQLLQDEMGNEVKCSLDAATDLLLELCSVGKVASRKSTKTPVDQSLVRAIQGCALHPFNIWRVKAVNAVNEAAIVEKNFNLAKDVGLTNVDAMRYYYGKNHQTYSFFLAKLSKLCVYCNDLYKGEELLKEAQVSVRVSYGDQHPIYHSVSELCHQTRVELATLAVPALKT
ncbi:N-lysine methyltransferase SMYD2 isoform X2 [Hyalella azteca]|nr:N-lysine methyltransferase SMYD2 isoform X2 [Hyalella azteca]XP_047738194.1 N-lysine methyltransferase SMYD2 isoform X2 [Hyalella azteca]